MGGMEMMLKAMGFDPAQLRELANGFLTEFKTIRETLSRIEKQNADILEQMENAGQYSERQPAGTRSLQG